MYSPNGFVASSSRTKKNAICNQPLAVIRISPGAEAQRPGRPASRRSRGVEGCFQALSPPPFSDWQPWTYATAMTKNTRETVTMIRSSICASSYQLPCFIPHQYTSPSVAVVCDLLNTPVWSVRKNGCLIPVQNICLEASLGGCLNTTCN